MKKHELLKFAYDNYPKGTVAISLGKTDHRFKTCGVYDIAPTGIVDSHSGWYIYTSVANEWSQIVTDEPVKIAIKVENEKEFHALMKYYDGLGWKPWNGHDIEKSHNSGEAIDFHDNYRSAIVEIQEMDNYKIITFSDFAKEHNIKLPAFQTNDGKWIYELDNFWWVQKVNGEYQRPIESCLRTHKPESDLITFSTKQVALDWIEAHKPKYPKVNSQSDPFGKLLHYEVEISDRGSILVGTKAITINGVVQVVSKSIIEDILKAMKELS